MMCIPSLRVFRRALHPERAGACILQPHAADQRIPDAGIVHPAILENGIRQIPVGHVRIVQITLVKDSATQISFFRCPAAAVAAEEGAGPERGKTERSIR